MIRKSLTMDSASTDRNAPKGPRRTFALWACALIAVAAGIVAAMNASELGWPAFLLLVGLAAISLIAIFGLVIGKPISDQAVADDGLPSESLRDAFEHIPEPSMIAKDGVPIYCNASYQKLAKAMGVTSVSSSPPSIDRLFGSKVKSASALIFRLHHTRSAGESSEEFIETRGADGVLRRFRVRVLGMQEGQLWQIKDLSSENSDVMTALASAPVGLFSVGADGQVLAMNSALRRWIGLAEGALPSSMSEFIENPESLLNSPKTIGRIVRNDTGLITQKGIVTPAVMTAMWQALDDEQSYASVAIYGHSGSTLSQVSIPSSIAAGSVLGSGLSASATVSGDTDAAAPFGIARLNGSDLNSAAVTQANAALVGMSGGQLQTGDKFASLFKLGDTQPNFLGDEAISYGEPYDATIAGRDSRPVNVYIVPDGDDRVVYFVDISARKDLENQLIQSQKMQAIGQLAGGVAHDFNNLLQAIRLNTDELLGRHPVGDPSYPELQKINQTVARAAGLVKKLLAFSRKQTLRTEVLDVTDTLSDLSILLKQVLVEKVSLNMVHGRSLPYIRADRGQLETALMNLCVNARDALLEQGGGTVTVTTQAVERDALKADGVDKLKADHYVCISVTDNGTGMSEEVQAKIFEPFFTTKEQGKGTGLGLATVYGIIQQSGGHLTVDSTLGKGTTFRIYLPVTSDSPEVATSAAKKALAKPSDLAGQGTVLFVEDEENVRVIAAKTLRKRGYTVIEAEDGEEAFEILQEGEHTFDLMISDVVMPGMDGPTLLKRGRKLLGDAKIVFISGYAEEEFSDILEEHPDITFLPKPFTLLQLAQRVKTELTPEDN